MHLLLPSCFQFLLSHEILPTNRIRSVCGRYREQILEVADTVYDFVLLPGSSRHNAPGVECVRLSAQPCFSCT